MGRDEFKIEIAALRAWHEKYKPIFFLPAGDQSWQSTWELLERIGVPSNQIWVIFDDAEGACFLSALEDAPASESCLRSYLCHGGQKPRY